MSARRWSAWLAALVLWGCGPVEPRFGSVSVSASAPRASLTGHTSAAGAPAIDLSPGCPGFVDAQTPEHVVRLDDASAITLTARSLRGPLAIAVVGPREVRCDSDEGTGHAPHVTISQPGEYLVHVGALESAADLPYELSVAPSTPTASGAPSGSDHRISVTVTSEPSGATVRTLQGESMGTTPAMFVLTVPESEMGSERHFVLEMPGHPSTDVGGRLIGETMVLHASLPTSDAPAAAPTPVVPTTGPLDVASTSPSVRIRDYHSATQSLEVAGSCTIGSMSVDVNAQHAFSQDLRIVLRGPTGAEATLASHGGGGRPYSPHTYAFGDARGAMSVFAGTEARGTWSLEVRDDAGEDEGALHGFALHFVCGSGASALPTPPPPVTRTPRTPSRIPRPPPRPTAPQPGVLDPWSSRPPPPVTSTPLRNGGASVVNPF